MINKRIKISKSSFVVLVLVIFSIFATIGVFISDAVRDGLEFMYLLPMFYGISIFLFKKSFKYKGLGLKIFHIIEFVRFIVQPVLIVLTNGEVSNNRMSIVNAASYRVSTIIQCVEIFISYATIYLFHDKIQNKYKSRKNENDGTNTIGIKAGGLLIIILYLIVLIYRFPIWYPALNIYGIKHSTTDGILLENTLFSAVKTAIFIYLLDKTIKTKGKKKLFIFILCILSVLFLILSYFGTNRALTLELTITSIAVLLYYLPKYRKLLIICIVPIAFALIFTMFVSKQFNIQSSEELSDIKLDLQYVSNQLEEYTNGPWCIAQTYEASIGLSFATSYKAIVKEISNALMVVCVIPGLQQLSRLVVDWSSLTDIYRAAFQNRNRGQIPAFSSGFFYCYGILGWILFPLGNFIAILLLLKYCIKSQNTNSILEKYIYLWSSILFGLSHCYCVRILLYCMSKYAWFVFLIIIGNKILTYKKRDIINDN